jgi:hypothetical protein
MDASSLLITEEIRLMLKRSRLGFRFSDLSKNLDVIFEFSFRMQLTGRSLLSHQTIPRLFKPCVYQHLNDHL